MLSIDIHGYCYVIGVMEHGTAGCQVTRQPSAVTVLDCFRQEIYICWSQLYFLTEHSFLPLQSACLRHHLCM
jgi:hypothetical protein